MRRFQTALIVLSLTAGCGGMSDYQDQLALAPSNEPSFHALGGWVASSIGGFNKSAEITADKADVDQRLIRNGSMTVVVPEFRPFEGLLESWLGEAGGFVSNASLSHYEGEVGWADITLRVPADQFDALVNWTEEQVKVEHLSVAAVDVTEQWVDIEARITNNRREEAVLLDLLGTDAASLADVLAVERELARVRGEIESAEGRMRVLSDQVTLATLQLSVRVEQPYSPLVADSFTHEMGQAFTGSISAMKGVAKGLTLVTIAAAPWLIIPGFGLFGLIAGARRWWTTA